MPLTTLIVSVVLLAISIAIWGENAVTFVKLPLQRWSVDREWCVRQIEVAKPIVDALEEYHTDRGHYPESLTELSPEYLSELPKPQSLGGPHNPDWYYCVRDSDAYQLSTTAYHWISSYDALMLRVLANWPLDWSRQWSVIVFKNHPDWRYMIGAQNLDPEWDIGARVLRMEEDARSLAECSPCGATFRASPTGR